MMRGPETAAGLHRSMLLGNGRWIVLSALVGLVAGVGAILFDLLFRLSQRLLLERIGRFIPPGAGSEGGPGIGPAHPWLLPVSLVLGALISGALVFALAPEAEGHGTDAVIEAFHRLRGKIRRRVPIVKAVASAITIGSGGSAGREGPIVQIGAGFGSFLADLLRLTADDRRLLMMAGVAGGVGGIFRAPLGATFFAAEVLYSATDFEYETLLPGLISAITSYSVFSSYAGWGFLFDVPAIAFHRPRQLLVYLVLGITCAVLGWCYVAVFYGMRDRCFRPLPLPRWLKPAAGALALGTIAVVFPQALGMGYGYVQEAIRGQHTVAFLVAFALVKIIATSLTISSGGSGGVFGPSLVIGGALGAAFGQLAVDLVPGFSAEPAAFTMVGMGGFFAGVAKVPFASVIMVMEMTGSYGLLVPSLLVAAISYFCLPRGVRLYENQVPRRVDSPVHVGAFASEILNGARLEEVLEDLHHSVFTVGEETPIASLVARGPESSQRVFPVVDAEGRLVGELWTEDLPRALTESPDVLARERMHEVPEPLVPRDSLARVARLLAECEADEMVVVRSEDDRTVLGIFGRRDLVFAYGRLLHRLHSREIDAPAGPIAHAGKAESIELGRE